MRKPSYGSSECAAVEKAAELRFFAALLLLLAPSAGFAEDAPVPAPSPVERVFELKRVGANDSTPEKIQVGDRLVFQVHGADGTAYVVKPPAPEAGTPLIDAGWEVFPGDGPGQIIAVPLKPGPLTLPSLSVHPAQPESAPPAGITVPVTLQTASGIAENDPKPEEPAPLRPPARVGLPLWVWIASIAAALALLGVIAWVLLRLSRKSRAPKTAPAPVTPPQAEDVVALETLNAIAAADWISRGAFKTHYFGVSEVLKTYFGARYRFDARESTTAELLRALEQQALVGDSLLDRVDSLFEKLDLVKFTDHIPHVAEGAAVLEEARSLVRLTRRPPSMATGGAS